MRRVCFFLLMVFISSYLIGQVGFNEKMEFDYYGERVIDIFVQEDKTLNLLTYKFASNKEDIGKFLLNKYDSSFLLKQSKEIIVDQHNQTLWYSTESQKSVVLVFVTKKGKMDIRLLDKKTFEGSNIMTNFKYKLRASRIKQVAEIGEYLYVIGSYVSGARTRMPFIFAFNKLNGQEKILNLSFDDIKLKRVGLNEIQTNGLTNEGFLFANAYLLGKAPKIYMQRLNGNGEMHELFNLSDKFDKIVQSLSVEKVSSDKYILSGNYVEKLMQIRSQSSGIFIAQMTEGKIDWVNYYDFLEFEDYLVNDFNKKFLVTMHPVLRLDDGFLVVAENYKRTYATKWVTSTPTGYSETGPGKQELQNVFDGFGYSHATIIKLSKTGEKMWDRNFNFNIKYAPEKPKKFLCFNKNVAARHFTFIYSDTDSIFTKKIGYDGNILEKETSHCYYQHSKVRFNQENSLLKYWYDNFYINSNEILIRNRTTEEKDNKRRWFVLINKFSFN